MSYIRLLATRWPIVVRLSIGSCFRSFLAVAALTAAAGTAEASNPASNEALNGQPRMTLWASPASVRPGQSATLNWSTAGVSGCQASGDWGGSRASSGSRSTGALGGDHAYRLSCSGPAGGVTRQVTVTVAGGGGPSVHVNAARMKVRKGGATRINWWSKGAQACRMGGARKGPVALNGSIWTGKLAQSAYYRVTCKRGKQTAIASVTVQVKPVPVVRWKAPTRNEDGSKLNDLAGYRLYWGHKSRHYVGSARVTSPFWTQYRPGHLPSGTYFVAVTAVDARGNESRYSNEIQVYVP